jgi:nucleoside-diphosphate kinase
MRPSLPALYGYGYVIRTLTKHQKAGLLIARPFDVLLHALPRRLLAVCAKVVKHVVKHILYKILIFRYLLVVAAFVNYYSQNLNSKSFCLLPEFSNFESDKGGHKAPGTNMEQTLVILKPSSIRRFIVGDVIARFQHKGLIISGIKMMQLDEAILREHYAHLVDRPFFPDILESMTATPVIVMCLKGKDAVAVVRTMTGATNSRNAAPGTIRGDYAMSGQENIVHASDSPENAAIELKRFFRDGEIFDYLPCALRLLYAPDEL